MRPLERRVHLPVFIAVLFVTACSSGDGVVTVVAVNSVVVTPASATVVIGGTQQLNATVLDAAGNALSGRTVAWTSSSASATVSATGLVTGASAGTAQITATSEGKSNAATITVTSSTFAPGANTTISGTQTFQQVNIPAGVTVTATGNTTLNVSGAVSIAGTLTGNCVSIAINGSASTTVTGAVNNVCTDSTAQAADLSIVGKGGIVVTGAKLSSSGDISITNDPTLTAGDFPTPAPLGTGVQFSGPSSSNAGAQNANDCVLTGATVTRTPPAGAQGAASETQALPGGDGKSWKVTCRGDGVINASTITAQNGGRGGLGTSTKSGSLAEARAGNGGAGGNVNVWVTGSLTFNGASTLQGGDGGAGGVATATGLANTTLTKGTNAQATGGRGGDGGLVDVRAGGGITIAGVLTFAVGNGGAGGSATATAADGNNAGTSAAQAGGDAKATGGAGGKSPNRTLKATGNVAGAPLVTGGNGGHAGSATATAGKGGAGNEAFPNGAVGGNIGFNNLPASDGSTANVGNGGNAEVRNLAGALVGTGGNGSAFTGSVGLGGLGWSDCAPGNPKKGGDGGAGGSASGRDGRGGTGAAAGTPGGGTFNTYGNGGNGGDGMGPGAGGAAGVDQTTTTGVKTLNGRNFAAGNPGKACVPLVFKVGVTVKDDPNGHEPFVRMTTVPTVTVSADGNTISITGPSPWITLTGTVNADGTFTATGSGTLAGFPNVKVSMTGTVTSGTITGVLTAGSNTPPTGLPNGAVTYNVAGTRQ